jgi:hypothetical protein
MNDIYQVSIPCTQMIRGNTTVLDFESKQNIGHEQMAKTGTIASSQRRDTVYKWQIFVRSTNHGNPALYLVPALYNADNCYSENIVIKRFIWLIWYFLAFEPSIFRHSVV